MYSIIVVDFHSIERTIDYLLNCYNSIIDSYLLHTIIVDNSVKGIATQYFHENNYNLVKEEADDINCEIYRASVKNRDFLLVCARENLGYGRGNNLGARVSHYFYNDAYLIFSNNDLQFTNPFELSVFTRFFNFNTEVAAIGPHIIGVDGSPQSPYKYTNMWQQTVLDPYHMLSDKIFHNFVPSLDYDGKSKKCYWTSGCFLVVDREKFVKCEGFDENIFLYAEEEILSERLKKLGYSFYFCNDITIVHNHNMTVHSHYSEVKRMSLSFHSSWYYFEHYLNVSKGKIFAAKILFQLFIPLYILKTTLKRILKK